MRAEDSGLERKTRSCFGKLSGRNAFKQRLQELGISLGKSEGELNTAFARFKELSLIASREIFDEDMHAFDRHRRIGRQAQQKEHYQFLSLIAASLKRAKQPYARICVHRRRQGSDRCKANAQGNGPVDATLNAIEIGSRQRL